MSDTEDHVEVELKEPENTVEIIENEPEVVKAAEIAPEDGIKELKRRLQEEQAARAEAERRAHQANVKAQEAYGEVNDTNYQLVANAIDTIKGRSDMLKAAFAEAMSVGDYAKTAEIQEAMSVNAVHLSELEKGRKAMENKARQPVVPVAPPQVDHIEQLAASVTPRSASWLRSNRDNLRDERAIKRMFRAHEDAIDDGIEPDSDAYFRFIEQRIGVKVEPMESPLSSAAAPAPRRSSPPPAAPVSRGSSRSGTVRLTREEVEAAQMFGMTNEEYAFHKNNPRN